MNNQHLVSLTAENVKKLKAVSLKVDHANGTLVICGKNGSGKSSVLDAILMAVCGKDYFPPQPIRVGEKRAEIVLNTENYQIRRTVNESGTTMVTVTDNAGMKASSPQTMLNELCGLRIGWDPIAFARMEPKQQLSELLKVCPVDIDLYENSKNRASAYAERTMVGRELRNAEAQFSAISVPHGDTERIDISKWNLKLSEMHKSKMEKMSIRNEIGIAERKISDLSFKMESAIAAYEAAKMELSVQSEIVKTKKAQEESIVEPIEKEFNDISQQIANAETINKQVELRIKQKDIEQEVLKKKKEVATLTEKISVLDSERSDSIGRTKFPVDGIGISDDGIVTYRGVPLIQASTSEQIRVGLAFAISANPKLRLAFIREGSLLDVESMKAVEDVAKEKDLLVLVERVEDGNPGSIEICDGEVA